MPRPSGTRRYGSSWYAGRAGISGAGNDIAELAALSAGEAVVFAEAMADAAFAVEAAAKPVVMAIEGACYGGSVALALAGDLRVATGTAMFAITPAKLGLLYLRSDLQRLTAAIGLGASKRLLYTGEAIDAARAEAIGLVDAVFPPDRFESGLQQMVASIAGGAPSTLRRTKDMLRGLAHGRAEPETTASLLLFAEATQGPDFREGHAALHREETAALRLGAAAPPPSLPVTTWTARSLAPRTRLAWAALMPRMRNWYSAARAPRRPAPRLPAVRTPRRAGWPDARR